MMEQLFAEMLEEDAEFRELMKEKVKECVKTKDFQKALTNLIVTEVKNMEVVDAVYELINDAVRDVPAKKLVMTLFGDENNE